MTGSRRPRSSVRVALTLALVLGLAACQGFPNTTFGAHSDVGHDIDKLTYLLLILGGLVFVLVEGLLVYVLVKFRARPGDARPVQMHGNTTLEVTWTMIPAIILAVIAIPTVRTIFKTQAPAPDSALQVQVIGHQWWWEFRYPQYKIVTANELYLPVGRTVNFSLETDDVIHSFWLPGLSGKRDVVHNLKFGHYQPNYLWFTPDSAYVWNGFCAEYCGTSHSNMRFRAFTVPPAEFAAWVKHQQEGPVFPAAAAAATTDTTKGAAVAAAPAPAVAPDTTTGTWPRSELPRWTVPETPLPAGLTVATTAGDPARGAQLFKTGACIGCHTIQGVSPGVIGPNLTHVGSRTTIGAGLYPNDMRHLTMWIKDARLMKPGAVMPPMGKGIPESMGTFTDQQIADIAAYLSSLK